MALKHTPLYLKNLTYLSEHYPNLASKLRNFTPKNKPKAPPPKISLKHPPKPTPILGVLGLRKAVLDAWLPHLDFYACVFFIDPSMDQFFDTCHTIDWVSILTQPNRQLWIGYPINSVKKKIFSRFMTPLSYPTTWVQTSDQSTQSGEYYQAIQSHVEMLQHAKSSDRAARYTQAKHFPSNLLENIPSLRWASPISAFKKSLINQPIVLIGPGPSLSDAYPYLRTLQSTIPLIAVDTALPALLDQNCIPDAVISVDMSETNLRHFNHFPESLNDVVLIASPLASPPLWRRYPGPKITYNPSDPWVNWIEKTTPSWGYIRRGLSVAVAGLNICQYLGATPIILVGLDLAVSADTAYASGTTKSDAPIQLGKSVLSNMGSDVQTSTSFNAFRWMLENNIQPGRVINTAKSGAKISGTRFLPLAQVLDRLPKSPRLKTPPFKARTPLISNPNGDDLSRRINRKINRFKTLLNVAHQGHSLSQTLSSRPALASDMVQLNQLYQQLTKRKTDWEILGEWMPQLVDELEHRQITQTPFTTSEKMVFLQDFFKQTHFACSQIIKHLFHAQESLKNVKILD